MPDLVVRAGSVLDGTGTQPFTADLAIRDGHIAEIGRVRDRAHRTIDADGALVIPGLCALTPPHDVATFDRNRSRHRAPGVTTTIEAIDRSVALPSDLGELVRSIDRSAAVCDRAVLMDFASLQTEVMGNKVRDHVPASAGDIEAMGSILASAISAGVVGPSVPSPGSKNALSAVLLAAIDERQIEDEVLPHVVALLSALTGDAEEVLDNARRLLSDTDISDVAISGHEVADDGQVRTAFVPADDESLVGFEHERAIVGPGLNPLALLRPTAQHDLTMAGLGLLWSRTAVTFGFGDRGILASDRRADLNVLDHFSLSDDLQQGVVSTLIAGIEIVSGDELTGATPGGLASPVAAL